jgi:hypothetical protein
MHGLLLEIGCSRSQPVIFDFARCGEIVYYVLSRFSAIHGALS